MWRFLGSWGACKVAKRRLCERTEKTSRYWISNVVGRKKNDIVFGLLKKVKSPFEDLATFYFTTFIINSRLGGFEFLVWEMCNHI